MCRDWTSYHLLWWKILRSSDGFHYFYSCLSPLLVVLTLQYLNKQFTVYGKYVEYYVGDSCWFSKLICAWGLQLVVQTKPNLKHFFRFQIFHDPPWQNWARLVARGVRGWSHSNCIKCTLSVCSDLVAVRPEDRSEEDCSEEKLQKEMSQSMLGWWTCLCFCLGGGLWRNLTGIKRPIDVSRSEERSCSGAGRSNLGCAALGMDFSLLLLGWWPLKDLYQSVWAHLRKNLVLELEGKPRQRSNLGCAAWGMDFSLLLLGCRALVDLSWLEINQRYFHLKCFVCNMNHSLAGSHLMWPEAFCFSVALVIVSTVIVHWASLNAKLSMHNAHC